MNIFNILNIFFFDNIVIFFDNIVIFSEINDVFFIFLFSLFITKYVLFLKDHSFKSFFKLNPIKINNNLIINSNFITFFFINIFKKKNKQINCF